MLVLGRKSGESIIINDDIKIKILEVGDKKVKIGITAPKELSVWREELHSKISESGEVKSNASHED